jgi:hypothetical protein
MLSLKRSKPTMRLTLYGSQLESLEVGDEGAECINA